MTEVITCTPRTLAPEQWEEAAENAIRVNPLNQPSFAALPSEFMPPPDHLALVTTRWWGPSVHLTVGFLDNPSAELRARILSHMNAWNKTANVKFVETADAHHAQVRINRGETGDPKWDGYWSYLGTDILKYHGPQNQTMNLQGFTMNTLDSEFYRVVRHETGHTLGFPHEHMRKELVDHIDRKKAIKYYFDKLKWPEQTVIEQVLTPLDPKSLRGTGYADPNSIMAYQIPASITKDGVAIPGGKDINESDYRFVGEIYRK